MMTQGKDLVCKNDQEQKEMDVFIAKASNINEIIRKYNEYNELKETTKEKFSNIFKS
jgi:flavoprotein